MRDSHQWYCLWTHTVGGAYIQGKPPNLTKIREKNPTKHNNNKNPVLLASSHCLGVFVADKDSVTEEFHRCRANVSYLKQSFFVGTKYQS